MKTKQTAVQAYEERQNDIGVLLDLISQELKHHAEFAKTGGLHWGHTGDLGAVRKGLLEVLAQLAQQDEAFIEKHLDEMREERK